MSQHVFTYESNMCSGRVRDYGVRPEGAGRNARLCGYRLRCNKRSLDASGKASVGKDQGSDVWGVVYRISDADLDRFDDGERGYLNPHFAFVK
jgi:hypothetical protein